MASEQSTLRGRGELEARSCYGSCRGGNNCPYLRVRGRDLGRSKLLQWGPGPPRVLLHFVFFGWALLQSCYVKLWNIIAGQKDTFAPWFQHCGSEAPPLPPWFRRLWHLLTQSSMTIDGTGQMSYSWQCVTSARLWTHHVKWTHISQTTLTCFFHWRRLRQVQRLLGRDVTANLVCTFMLLWLDYCNALLAGLPYSTIEPLQSVINAAVRLVCGLRLHNHVLATMTCDQWWTVTLWWHPETDSDIRVQAHL